MWHCQGSLPCHSGAHGGRQRTCSCAADLMLSISMEIRGADQLEAAKLHVRWVVSCQHFC